MTVGKLSYLTDVRPAGGNAFFVDGVNGVATNNGRDPDSPLLTLKSALALCKNGNRDIIYVLDYPWAGGVTDEDEPIVVNKSTVTIVGIGIGTYNIPVIGASGNTAAISLTAHRVRFIGLEFVTGAGSSHGCVQIDATCHGVEFWRCLFERDIHAPGSGAQDGILVSPGFGAPDLRVVGCIFGPGLSRDGVRVVTNITRGMIGLPGEPSNFFDRCPEVGINLGIAAGVTAAGIFDNRFMCYSDVEGKAITIGSLCGGCFIDGNSANFGSSAMTNNPFKDLAGAIANTWGRNFKGGIAVMPVIH